MLAQQPATILFAYSDGSTRDSTAGFLRQAGFTVWEAATGGEALRLAEGQPDLILLDGHLPDLDGFEVCRRLKEDPATASVPVLHITDAAPGLPGSADVYLIKPIEPAELIAHLNILLRLRRAEEEARAGAERDLRERKRAEEAQAEQATLAAFTAEVAVALAGPDPLEDLLQHCAEAMTLRLGAALARVWTLNPLTDVLELQASAGLYAHRDGAHARIPVGQGEIGHIAHVRRPHLTNDVPHDPRIRYPEWARGEGLVAFAGYPLICGGRLVGVLGLFARQPLSAFALQALAAAADNLAVGIQRKQNEQALQVNEDEFRVAHRVQQRLFPRTPPDVPGFDVHGRSYPAQATGGDYYDYIPLRDGALGIAIGDVSGKGLGPALLMASIRASLRTLALVHDDVSEILTIVNRTLIGDTQDEFVTIFLAHLDPRSGSFIYASAGHATGYLLDTDGRVKQRLESTAMPLGLFPDTLFPASAPVLLGPGEVVLLLTDGVTDALSPDETRFGTERTLAVARFYRHDPARRIVENLYGAVRAFMQDMAQFDDVTLVVIKQEAAG